MKQSMKKIKFYDILIVILIIASYPFLLVLLHPEKVWNLVREDGIIENLQVIFPIIATGVFLYLFFRSKSATGNYLFKTHRNYFFLLLSIFSIIIVGEEINWGQRVSGNLQCTKNGK